MGIRDESAPERRERGPREGPLRPEKLEALKVLIAREKAKGVDVGDIETYLSSGVVTKEGLATRLEAINRQSKRLEAGNGPSGEAGQAPAAPSPEVRPEAEKPENGSTPPAPGPDEGPPADGGLPPDEKPDTEPNGEPAAPSNGQATEGARKLKKVKKVVK